jgi:hypothetical protein
MLEVTLVPSMEAHTVSVIPALRRLKQGDPELEASLSY